MSPDVAASARARLLAWAKSHREEFERTLVRYAAERLLYRLGASAARERCILKGATLLTVWMPGSASLSLQLPKRLSRAHFTGALRPVTREASTVPRDRRLRRPEARTSDPDGGWRPIEARTVNRDARFSPADCRSPPIEASTVALEARLQPRDRRLRPEKARSVTRDRRIAPRPRATVPRFRSAAPRFGAVSPPFTADGDPFGAAVPR